MALFFPCSRLVGGELTRYIVKSIAAHPEHPLKILEVGAGTGSMTDSIVKNIRSVDHLDAIEISADMCKELYKKFDCFKNVAIHCISILDWQPGYTYDFIISTLPFNSLDFELTNAVIDHLARLITPNGILSYVAYTGMAQIKEPFLWGERKKKHLMKMEKIREFRNQFEIEKQRIIKNIPPINIYHLQISSSNYVITNTPGTFYTHSTERIL